MILNERIGYQEIEDGFQASVDRHTRGKRYNDKTFMATGGMSPEGVSMLSRYHNLDGTGGFSTPDTIDSATLADYALDWNGLIIKEITAIMDDETISSVLPKHFG